MGMTVPLYVPELSSSDPCQNWSQPHVPQNVTRKSDIPAAAANRLFGLAPWLSDHSECALPYIEAAARNDATQGLIFYPTDSQANSSGSLPENSDWGVSQSQWDEWTSSIEYPIWAVGSSAGGRVMTELSRYSGIVAQSPIADTEPDEFSAENQVGLGAWVDNHLDEPDEEDLSLFERPWIFVIMVLAIILALVGLVTLMLHLNQIRMRRDLRRRVAAGEVDLERLGIRRQRVPLKMVERMPLYEYQSETGPSRSDAETLLAASYAGPFSRKTLAKRNAPFSQTTCAICLDNFVHHESVVRELPCQHIFHPDCVDDFLVTSTSLCPVCKKSVLPGGVYSGDITNSIVRRERLARRRLEYGTTSANFAAILPKWSHRFLSNSLLRHRLRPLQGAEGSEFPRQETGTTARADDPSNEDAQPSTTNDPPPADVPLPPSPSSSRPTSSPLHSRPHSSSSAPPPPSPPAPAPAASSSMTLSPTRVTSAGDLEMGTRTTTREASAGATAAPATRTESVPFTWNELPPEVQRMDPADRRRWMHERMLGTLPPTENQAAAAEEAAEAQMPIWRRMRRRIFFS